MTSSRLSVANSNSDKSKEDHFANKFIQRMLESIHTIKLFHWKTKSYAAHKATDNLHSKLGDLVDRYVEVFIGKYDLMLLMSDYSSLSITNLVDNDELENYIKDLITFLIEIHTDINSDNMSTDLTNMRDEIIGELNQFLYLLRLK